MAPELLLTIPYQKDGRSANAHIYTFWNGGNLTEFIKEIISTRSTHRIPEALFWQLCKRLCNTLALCYSGYIRGAIEDDISWILIIHGDMHTSNIFLHWPADGVHWPHFRVPHFLVGDWSLARRIENHTTSRKEDWRVGEKKDSTSFHRALSSMHGYVSIKAMEERGKVDADSSTCPDLKCAIETFERLWKEADVLAKNDPRFSKAKNIAISIADLAHESIANLTEDTALDSSWTRPAPFTGFDLSRELVIVERPPLSEADQIELMRENMNRGP